MDRIQLSVKKREKTGNVRAVRLAGSIPGIMYGRGTDPISVSVPLADFHHAFAASGETTLVDISLDGAKHSVLIHEVQFDPLTGVPQHADFFRVRMDEKIEADIPIEFVGASPAVKELGGVLVKSLDELPVSCLPGDIPHQIDVNIETLKTFDDTITVGDLGVDLKKVEVRISPETIVATVAPPRSEEELEKLEEKVETDVSAVGKVEKEKKEEAEEEGEKKSE